jgi:hypothetical protein
MTLPLRQFKINDSVQTKNADGLRGIAKGFYLLAFDRYDTNIPNADLSLSIQINELDELPDILLH